MRSLFRREMLVWLLVALTGAGGAQAASVGFEFNQNLNAINYTIFNGSAANPGKTLPGTTKITQAIIDITNAHGEMRFGGPVSFDLRFSTSGPISFPFTTTGGSAVGVTYPTPAAANGQQVATLTFSDFDAFESLTFGVAIDAHDQPDFKDNAYELIGALVTVTFDNGQVLQGTTADRGNLIFGVIVDAPLQAVPIPPALALFPVAFAATLGIGRRRAFRPISAAVTPDPDPARKSLKRS